MWNICDVQPFLLLPAVLDLRLLYRKPHYMVGPYLLSLLDAGIALQGLITQVFCTARVCGGWGSMVSGAWPAAPPRAWGKCHTILGDEALENQIKTTKLY